VPGFNGSGPMGQGPLTGRGLGICRTGTGRKLAGSGYGMAANNFGGGRGRRNRGIRGCRNIGIPFGYPSAVNSGYQNVGNEYIHPASENEKSALQRQKVQLEAQLKEVNKLLKDFDIEEK